MLSKSRAFLAGPLLLPTMQGQRPSVLAFSIHLNILLKDELHQLTPLLTTTCMAARAALLMVLVLLALVITGVVCRVVFCTVHTKGCCPSPVCTGESYSWICIAVDSSVWRGNFVCTLLQ